ncbi:MAG: TIGR03667 family PPOX class F420-dependent oxidoreductase [Armatimonadota bacterium]|nr:TIGR03667 family PPOX class F420-dependent oxidoreductase [Armatimonadota bacterium]
MLNLRSRLGRRVDRRLRREQILWFTTVDRRGTPQPRPVWFHWDGRTALIFSEPGTAKVRHLQRRRRVAVHLNTDVAGGEVAVLTGEARILRAPPAAARVRAYLLKYRQGLSDLETSSEQFRRDYSVPILFTPRRLRGF